MSELKTGTIVHLTNGQTAKVKKLLGEGGQGYVYLVDMAGKEMALKWYKKDPSTNPVAFYKNLCRNALNGAPSPVFIWPKYVTNKENDSFGYIMDLRPQGYYEFGQFLLGKQKFTSFLALTTAAIDICDGFKALHAQGLSYQDLNDGNFFINPKTGHVMICDNDNAFPNGEKSGILGKARYMAPEVVIGKDLPNTYTDKFSLSVILFMLFYMNHPFEGAKVLAAPCMTEKHEKKFYGSEILFICDLNDKSNQPVRGIHNNVIRRWPYLPSILRKVFTEEFGKDKLRNPTRRFNEQQWLDTITLVRDSLIRCPLCGQETFVSVTGENKCMECGRAIQITNTLSINKRSLILTKGNLLYLDRDNVPDLQVVADPKDANKLKIQNLTPDTIVVDTTVGTTRPVDPKGLMPVKAGLTLHIKVRGQNFKCEIK